MDKKRLKQFTKSKLHTHTHTTGLKSHRQRFSFTATCDKSKTLSFNCHACLLNMFFNIPEKQFYFINIHKTLLQIITR